MLHLNPHHAFYALKDSFAFLSSKATSFLVYVLIFCEGGRGCVCVCTLLNLRRPG